MKLRKAVLILLFASEFSLSQFLPGARQISLSNSDVALSNDVFSLFNNPAGLAQLNWREFGIYYSPAPFGIKELSNAYISYLEPSDYGNFAAGAMTYGFELYKENKISLGYATKFENRFFAGITVTLNNLTIKNYGSDNSVSFNVGGLAYISNKFRWGFSLLNAVRSTYGNEKNQIPVILHTGFSYDITETTSLNATLQKSDTKEVSFNFGVEYDIIKNIELRSGINSELGSFSAGIGILFSLLQLDYAFFNHQDLGLTHQAGIIINFSGDEQRKLKIKKYLNL